MRSEKTWIAVALLLMGSLSSVSVITSQAAVTQSQSQMRVSCNPTLIPMASKAGIRCQVTVVGAHPNGNVTFNQYTNFGHGLFKTTDSCVLVHSRCSFQLVPKDVGSVYARWSYSGDADNKPSEWWRVLTIGTPPKGLKLDVSVSSKSILTGQQLEISVKLRNTLKSPLNLSISGSWRIPGYPISMWSIPQEGESIPTQFMIVKGHLTLNDLQIVAGDPGFLPAARVHTYGVHSRIDHIIFRPSSTVANLTGVICGGGPCSKRQQFGSFSLTSNFNVSGYWAYPFNASESFDVFSVSGGCVPPSAPCFTYAFPEVGPIAQHLFTPGTYTLVVTDEWGQAVVLYFSVK